MDLHTTHLPMTVFAAAPRVYRTSGTGMVSLQRQVHLLRPQNVLEVVRIELDHFSNQTTCGAFQTC